MSSRSPSLFLVVCAVALFGAACVCASPSPSSLPSCSGRFGGSDYVATPAGCVRSDCVHSIASSAVDLHRDSQGRLVVAEPVMGANGRAASLFRTLPKCDVSAGRAPMFLPVGSGSGHRHGSVPNDDYLGWTTYTAWNYSASIDVSLGYFSVPDTPKQTPEVLYVFTGLQNIDWIPVVDPDPTTPFDIIQPVLQYPADAGLHWSLKSWYVTLDVGVVVSDEVPCKVGDNIFGNMTRTGAYGYFVGGTCSGGPTTITHSAVRLHTQPWAYNTIECYGCSGCGTYPTQPITFSKLQLFAGSTQLSPNWVVDPKPSKNKQCKEKSTVQDAQTVVVTFQ